MRILPRQLGKIVQCICYRCRSAQERSSKSPKESCRVFNGYNIAGFESGSLGGFESGTISQILNAFYLSTGGTKAEKIERLKEHGAPINVAAVQQLQPGKQINLKSTLETVTDSNLFKHSGIT